MDRDNIHGQRLLDAIAIGEGVLFLPFFTTRDARHVRGVCRELRALVTNFAWDDRTLESRVAARLGAVALWHVCFPRAVACTLFQGLMPDKEFVKTNLMVTDGDLALLRGVRYLDMTGCQNITNDGLALVADGRNLHTLNITGCRNLTNTAFAYLAGIHTLNMSSCDQNTITNAAFAHLAGIHTLDMSNCNQNTITDAAFAHLTGILNIYLFGCNLTPKAMRALIVAVNSGTFGRFVRKVYMDEAYTWEFDDDLLWFRDYGDFGVIVATQY